MAVGLTAVSLSTLLILIRIGLGHGSGCVTGRSSPAEFQTDGVEYLLPQAPALGYQAIVPGMRFNCHGYVTDWSALFALDTRFASTTSVILTHHMYFQLWRPVVTERESRYERVNDDYIQLSSNAQELTDIERPADLNIGFLRIQARVGETESRMYFRPGDVVGFFMPNFTSIAPLGVTFRRATTNNASVDMYSYRSNSQLCEVSECGRDVTVHSPVLPQISVNYVEVDPSAPTPLPQASTCSSIAIEPCLFPTDTPTESPTSDSEPSGVMVPLIAWIIGGVVVLLFMISVVIIIILAVIIAFQRGKKAERRRNNNGSSNSSSIGAVTPYASANLLGYASSSSEASFKRSQNDRYPGANELRYTPLGVSNLGNGIGQRGGGGRGGGADTNSDIYSRRTSESPPATAENDVYRAATDSISLMTSSTVTSPSNLGGENGIYNGVITGLRSSSEQYGNVAGNGIRRSVLDTRSENARNSTSPYRTASDMRNELQHLDTNHPETSASRSRRSSAQRQSHPDQRSSSNQPQGVPWYMGDGVTYYEEAV